MRSKGLLVTGSILVIVGIVGVAATLALGQSPMMRRSDAVLPRIGGSADAGVVERMFIQEMVPHHQDAIDMADLAIENAEHPELRELARDIKRTQTDENEQMRSWYRDWFGETLEPGDSGGMMGGRGGMGGMMGGDVDLDELEDADPFDKEFIEQMIPHHQMAVMMAGMAGSASGREDFRQFTGDIVDVQREEIERMSDWYDEWYGR